MPLFSNFSDRINGQDARWSDRSDLFRASLRPDWRKMGVLLVTPPGRARASRLPVCSPDRASES
jgi:hypothetical protein